MQGRGEGKERIESGRCQVRKDIMAEGIFTSSQDIQSNKSKG